MKIPESPNIIGSEPVLRSPDMVQPVREIPQFSVDFSDLGDSIQDVGRAYQEMVRDQNKVYMNALKVDYNKHMSDYQQQIFDNHKGKDALYLYDRYIRPESNKWLANAFGDPKDDGHIRIADKKLQKEFNEWVFSQQPTYISSCASYGQRQFDMWRNSVWDQQNQTAANMMLSATSNATIENAINLIRQTEYDMNRGADKKYIEMSIAAKVDTGLSGYVSKRAVQDPYGAFLQLDNNPIVSDNLTSATKEKLKTSIRSSYKDLATSQYADFQYSGGTSGSVGLLNRPTIAEVFGTTDEREIDAIIADIQAKGKEKADATRKQQAGIQAQNTLMATNAYLEATNDQDKIEAKKNLFVLNPDAAIAIDNAETENLATRHAFDVLGDNAGETISAISSEISEKSIEETLETAKANLINKGYSEEDAEKISQSLRKPISGTKLVRKELTEEDVSAAKNNLLSSGKYTEEQVDAAVSVWRSSEELKNNMDRYKELSARISSGELQAYDPEEMGSLPYQMQVQLMRQQQVSGEYFKTKNELEKAGISLESAIKDSGADAQFSRLDMDSQNLLRRNIVAEVNKYKANNGGQLPDKDSLNGIVYRVQKNSVSPEMTLVQNIADSQNLSAEDLTDEQRYSLAVYNAISPSYNQPSKSTLAEQIGRAEKAISRLSRSSALSASERVYISTNKEYLVRMLQAGDVKGIATFIGLAKQGGF